MNTNECRHCPRVAEEDGLCLLCSEHEIRVEAQQASWRREQEFIDRYVEATTFDTPLDFVIARELADDEGEDAEWIF